MSGRIILSTIFFTTLVACAVGMGDVDPQKALATPEGYCNARAEAECTTSVVQKCGAKDQTSCEKTRDAACIAEIPQGTTYVPEAASACIGKTREAYSDGTLTSQEIATIKSTCAKVFSGPGGVRAQCTVDADCSSKDNLSCIIRGDATSTMGKCLTPRVVQPGGSCAGESDTCTEEFFCDSKSSMCVARAALGEDCYMKQCLAGLKCVSSLFGGGCTALKGAGIPCTADSECTSDICNKAKGSSEGTCVDMIVLSPVAAACAQFQSP